MCLLGTHVHWTTLHVYQHKSGLCGAVADPVGAVGGPWMELKQEVGHGNIEESQNN